MIRLTISAAVAGIYLALSGAAFGADPVPLTVTGEVIDTFCYATAGARGEGHRTCGLACAEKGIPIALLENDTDKVYVLLPNKNAQPVPKGLVAKMGLQATVAGKSYRVGGSQFLTVDSFK